jgi:hypothetical protein
MVWVQIPSTCGGVAQLPQPYWRAKITDSANEIHAGNRYPSVFPPLQKLRA